MRPLGRGEINQWLNLIPIHFLYGTIFGKGFISHQFKAKHFIESYEILK